MAFNQQLLLWEERDNLCPCCIIHTVLQLIMTFTSNHIAFEMKTFWSVKQVRPELISLMQKKANLWLEFLCTICYSSGWPFPQFSGQLV